MTLSEENKTLARFVAGKIGISPKMMVHHNPQNNSLPVLYLTDPVNEDIKYTSTIGLSDYANIIKKEEIEENLPVEIILTAYRRFEKASYIPSTCGFMIMEHQWKCYPGALFLDVVEIVIPDSELKHILFCHPFLWKDKLPYFLKTEEKTTNFLLALPISEKEKNYKKAHGTDALLNLLFVDNNTDINDFDRKSVI